MVAIVTDRIYKDEPCYGLFEGEEKGRWVQKVWVVRDDCIARYQLDLGPASDFEDVVALVMPSQGDDTVAELQAYAEKNRHDHYWSNRSKEMLSESTLIEDHLRLLDQETKTLLNQSVFGPGVSVQRNAVPRQLIARRRNGK